MHMLQNKDSDPYRLVQERYIKIISIRTFFLRLENNAFDQCIGYCLFFLSFWNGAHIMQS